VETDGPAGIPVGGNRSNGIRGQGHPIWDPRSSIDPFHRWAGSARHPPIIVRGFGIWTDGFGDRMRSENIRGGRGRGVGQLVLKGLMVSSAFIVWQGEGTERKGHFVVNFSSQSQHWPKGSVKMETLPCFGLSLQRGDHLMSLDIKSGYRHFYLHPCMRDYFLFRS
jgi:hypothetical protein